MSDVGRLLDRLLCLVFGHSAELVDVDLVHVSSHAYDVWPDDSIYLRCRRCRRTWPT